MPTTDLQRTTVRNSSRAPARGGLLGLFSSIWLGIVLLTILFLYSSVGSAGLMVPGHWGLSENSAWIHDIQWIIPWTQIHIRQAPGLEMTEFEWFHWWPFDLMIALICANIIVATLRRIPFRPINYGVWMIHAGILILCIGSVIYFGLKIEGDAPVIRRQVVASVDGYEPVSMPAIPGNRAVVGRGEDAFMLEVWSVDPRAEVPAGDGTTQETYAVTVNVQTATSQFMRRLVAGRPDLSGDLDRYQVVAELPGFDPVTLPAEPGGRATIGSGDGAYVLEVFDVNPQYTMLSGDDAGKQAFSVTVSVQAPTQTFMRQLVAGRPQYTEDVIRTDDPQQPMQRAKKVNPDGDPLVDETIALGLETLAAGDSKLALALEYDPQTFVYLANNIAKSWALYVREVGQAEWIQRPVDGLPLYNDYVASRDDVWLSPEDDNLPPRPLDVRVPAWEEGDPLADVDLRITSYLRHAEMRSQWLAGGSTFNPAATVRLENAGGERVTHELLALDPRRSSAQGGWLAFRWVGSAAEREALGDVASRGLTVSIPGTEIEVRDPLDATMMTNPHLDFTPVEGTEYAYRVSSVQDGLNIGGRMISLAMVEIRRGKEVFQRWVFDDPSLTRDLLPDATGGGHQQVLPLDEGIVMSYDPGAQVAPILLVAGPEPTDLGLQLSLVGREPEFRPVRPGTPVEIEAGITLTVVRYAASTREEMRPAIVPRTQRDRDAREQFSMVKVEVPVGGVTQSVWVPYHHYAFRGPNESLRRFPYRPARVELADGRQVELILSRQRQPLPAPVVLEDFQFKTHVGGFTGSTLSILDWTSSIRFAESNDQWTDVLSVSMNDPAEHLGYWYFQAQWDPPMGPRAPGDRPSEGLNYTVLGVGNRHGVNIQLFGTVIAVIGMLYAFYVKPVIRRRRMLAVRAEVEARAAGGGEEEAAARPAPEPAAALAGLSPEDSE